MTDLLGPPLDATGDSDHDGGGGRLMSNPETDALSVLFDCSRFVHLFPTGMPVRACLRRQMEHRAVKDAKGAIRSWTPAHEYCATACELGKARRRIAAVPASTCPKCGAARIGAVAQESCGQCEDLAAPKKAPPPTSTRLPAPEQERIWREGAVPDVGIATMARKDVGLSAADEAAIAERVAAVATRRQRRPAPPPPDRTPAAASNPAEWLDVAAAEPRSAEPPPAPPAPVNNEEPVTPAEEERMAEKCEICKGEVRPRNGKITQPCRKCRKAPNKAAAAEKKGRAAPPPAPTRLPEVSGDLEAKPVPQLVLERHQHVTAIAEIDEELRRRREQIDLALGTGKAA
jgi:hypothetical protein